jgi:hypothetical protein
MNKDTLAMIQRLNSLGLSNDEAFTLRRIAMTFSRWDELKCGTCSPNNPNVTHSIERDEETGKPFFRVQYPTRDGYVDRQWPIADRGKGAQKRLNKIMSNHADLWSYHQGDPRGASLYIGRKSELNGGDLHALYTRGVAVYK